MSDSEELTPSIVSKRVQEQELSEPFAPRDVLKLSGMGVREIRDLGALPKLRRLDLSNNRLRRLKHLDGASDVTWLKVSDNELKGASLGDLAVLPHLVTLDASRCKMKDLPASSLAGAEGTLKALILGHNKISGASLSHLSHLTSINTLVLSNNRLGGDGSQNPFARNPFRNMRMLKKLSLSYNNLPVFPDLSSNKELQEVRLSHNLIAAVPETIKSLEWLRILDLGHNQVEFLSHIEPLEALGAKLHQLTLAGNAVCEADRDAYTAWVSATFKRLHVLDGRRQFDRKRPRPREAESSASAVAAGSGSVPAAKKPRGPRWDAPAEGVFAEVDDDVRHKIRAEAAERHRDALRRNRRAGEEEERVAGVVQVVATANDKREKKKKKDVTDEETTSPQEGHLLQSAAEQESDLFQGAGDAWGE